MYIIVCCLVVKLGLGLGLRLDLVFWLLCTRFCANLVCNCHGPVFTISFVVSRINLLIWQRDITSIMPRSGLGMLSVGTTCRMVKY